jgi:hypothetical protein
MTDNIPEQIDAMIDDVKKEELLPMGELAELIEIMSKQRYLDDVPSIEHMGKLTISADEYCDYIVATLVTIMGSIVILCVGFVIGMIIGI